MELIRALMRERKVMGPVAKDGALVFDWLDDPDDIRLLDGRMPRISAKQALLPRTEVLFYYKVGKTTEIAVPPPPPEPRVLFGLRPCDVRAVKVLDAVFGAEPFPDELYLARRRATVIVGLGRSAEQNPPTCFFEQLGIGSMDNADCDLFLTELGPDRFIVEVLTQAGREAVGLLEDLPEAGEDDLAKLAELRDKAAENVVDEFSTEEFCSKLEKLFESPVWERVGEACLGCGACTYLCPTCHCFDVQDETHGDRGCRVRNWDTCQFELFTRHASAHNPRTAQKQRVRQRILHKFEYGRKNFGITFCTGCGRCIGVCPVNNDMQAMVSALKETE